MLWIYRSSAMLKVNFKDIVTVNSLVRLIIKVVRYEDIAFLFVVFNFSSWSSCKSNCLTKFTASIFTIQFSLSRIIDVGNLGCLGISSVRYCNFNIFITKLESLLLYFILIRCIASNTWRNYTIDGLSIIIAPSYLPSYIIFGTCFVEGNRLSFIWLSRIAIIIKIMNRTCYSIISSYIFSAVLNMIINNNSLIQT